ncbi:MAG TPA: GNAT family N-acetyltransferase [Vineibacter sp.]|nr:GNAT family N-acetyltransferase [Vineibacter sp.]
MNATGIGHHRAQMNAVPRKCFSAHLVSFPIPCHTTALDSQAALMTEPGQTPILRSDRLLLRPHREEDLDALAAMWRDPDVVRHIGGRPFTREEVWHRMLRYRGHWALRPYGYWAVIDRVSGRFIGDVGLADWQREGITDLDGAPEAGWAMIPAAHGQGFAAEALRTMLQWVDTGLCCPIVCMIDSENAASIRLAIRLGFEETSKRVHRDRTSLFFRRPARQG